jgi:hypothetical protein
MRYLKRQSTNSRLIAGRGVVYDQYEQLIIPGTGAILVPKGATADRPNPAEVGQLRYNTDTRSFEYYEGVPNGGNAWKQARFREPVSVTKQNLGNGDDQEVNFGPLNANDVDFYYPAAPEQVLVMVENVLQIPDTNYSIVQQPCYYNTTNIGFASSYNGYATIVGRDNSLVNFVTKGFHADQTITVSGAANSQNNGTFTVVDVGIDLSFPITPAFPSQVAYIQIAETLITESNGSSPRTITLEGLNSGGQSYAQTITINNVAQPAFYLSFGTPVPTGKPVNVLHNFDK